MNNNIIMDSDRRVRKGKKKRVGRVNRNEKILPIIKMKKKHEKQYEQELNKAIDKQENLVMKHYKSKSIRALLSYLGVMFGVKMISTIWKDTDSFYKKMLAMITKDHGFLFGKFTKETIGIDLKVLLVNEKITHIMSESIAENVKQITDLNNYMQQRISNLLNEALVLDKGKTIDLQTELEKTFGFSRSKAKFIARDQSQRYFNKLNEHRQKDVGIEKYMWITSKDSRVRDTHKVNSRKVFYWSDPSPITGHPGHDYNCRCTASAIIEV